MSHRLLALWATPRTVSTAFERMVIERGDHLVVDEPYSVPYYLGPDQRSARFPVEPGAPDGAAVTRMLLADADAGAQPVFVKDMAYQVLPWVDDELLQRATSTFLVRDPAWALPSLADRWPDFTDDEAGYDAQGRLFDRACAAGEVVVIDSDDLRRDPVGIVRAWCERVGIAFLPSSLSWEPGMQPQWVRWQDWYGATAASTGFQPLGDGAPPAVASARVADAIAAARPTYERLRAHRLHPT